MSKADWSEISKAALRHGQSLKEASAAYRAANAHLHNPGDGTSPEMHRRHHHTSTVGSLLRRGVPFKEALRRVDQGFDAYQHTGHVVERSITHPGSRENPDRKKWVVYALVGGALWWVWQRQRASVIAGPIQPQTPLVNPNPAQTGGGSYQALTLVPSATAYGGYSVYGAR